MTSAETVNSRASARWALLSSRMIDAESVALTGLPTGPRWPALLQTIGLVRFRHRFVPWAFRRYGDVFTVRTVPRGRPLVIFTRPEHSKEIFAGDPEVFCAGKGNAILGPIMGDHSLLLVDGAAHRRARSLLMPAFNGHALRGYAALIAAVTRDQVSSWPHDEEFAALDRTNALTLEVILRVVFGVADEDRLTKLRPLVNATVDVSPVVLLGSPYPLLRRIGPWRKASERAIALDNLIYAEIAERRAAADLRDRTDVLSRLILVDADGDSLSDEELRDQLVTLLLAGHETTATALAWALYELGRNADLRARTRDAALDTDDGDAWLEAAFKESMRLHPVIPMVVRMLTRPATVAGHALPEGATVATSILIAHAREDNYAEPDAFRPDRFLNQNPPTNTWIPFGGGVRRCIGAGFSMMEGAAVLREIFGNLDLESVGEDEPKVRNITSVPRNGARIVVRRRPSPHRLKH